MGNARTSLGVFSLGLLIAITPGSLQAQATAQEYRDACDGGDLVPCAVLGLIYETGASGTRDLGRAVELYERACTREVAAACRRLELTTDGEPVDTSFDESIRVGYVADAYDGRPLGGAIVQVRVRGSGERRYVSDVAGRVVLDPLPRGQHPIEVRRGGYVETEGQLPVPWDTDFLILMERVAEEDEPSTGRIFGQVLEEGGSSGIADVDIVISGSTDARVVSNGQGRFYLERVAPGRVDVLFLRLGYESRSVAIDVPAGRTVEIYAAMSAQPVELEAIEVSVGSRYLARSGFYERLHSSAGATFTHRDIAALNPMLVGDVVRRVAGIRVVTEQFGVGAEAISNRRRVGLGDSQCRLRPYFNGVPLVDFNIELMPPDELEALEVYQGPNVPIEYFEDGRLRGATCGVVLLWSRDPSRGR